MHKMFVMVIVTAGAIGAADSPYVGTWKLNPAKSDFGATIITIAQTNSGEMLFTEMGESHSFRIDGKDYAWFLGRTAAWKQIDPNTWIATEKLNGKIVMTDTAKVSSDGQTQTVNFKEQKPDGGTTDTTVILKRVSAGTGLAGKWRVTSEKTSAVDLFQLTVSGNNLITYKSPDPNIVCEAKFDDMDYPETGPTIGKGLTLAFKKTAAGGLELTEKSNGKPRYHSIMIVSADGKTLTETGDMVGANEKVTLVYERQ